MSSSPESGRDLAVDATAETGRSVWVIIVAGGSGTRFGGLKQFEPLAGRTVIDWSIAAARKVAAGVVVVLPPSHVDHGVAGVDAVVAGGVARSDSVRAGLAALPSDAGIVLVHDAARPLASSELFARVAAAVRDGADAVVPAVELVDTIRARDGGVVDRARLVAVQTPQGFRTEVLRAAHLEGAGATDDAGLAERAGFEVVVIEGEPTNRKITDASDLVVADALLRSGRPSGTAGSAGSVGAESDPAS